MYDSKRQNWMALISDPLSFLSSSSSDPIRFCRASIRARLRSSNALLELSSSRSLTPRVAGSSVPLLCAFTATEIALTAINPTTLAGANSRKPVRKLAKMPTSCVTLPTIDGFSLRATSRHSRETHVMAFFYGFFFVPKRTASMKAYSLRCFSAIQGYWRAYVRTENSGVNASEPRLSA